MGASSIVSTFGREMTLRRLAWWIYAITVYVISAAVLALLGYLTYEAMRLGL
jgi:hypothetical protein